MADKNEFIKQKKDGEKNSAWSYFLTEKNKPLAQCKQCKATIKTNGGSTKGLHTHLSAVHNTKIIKENEICSPNMIVDSIRPPAKRKLTDFFSHTVDNSLDALLARMTAKDGLPFSTFITSRDLRGLILTKGYTNLPKSAATIREMVMKYGDKVRGQIKAEIANIKDNSGRFSISFDEWTSNCNKRFMNVCVYSINKKWNLGLIRVDKSLTAEASIEILDKRLQSYGISLSVDIVAMVTDGPNVMTKIGKILDIEHQVCFAHVIHLAVCDVLYKKKKKDTTSEETFGDMPEEFVENLDSGLIIENVNGDDVRELSNECQLDGIVSKFRKIGKIFKNYTVL